MFLDLLNRHFLPNAPQIFAVAESAMSKVKAVDLLFYNHLKEVAKINPTINPKVMQYIYQCNLMIYKVLQNNNNDDNCYYYAPL